MGERTGDSQEVDQEVRVEDSAQKEVQQEEVGKSKWGFFSQEKAVNPGHVHEWTQVTPTKRKCKPCGAIERSE